VTYIAFRYTGDWYSTPAYMLLHTSRRKWAEKFLRYKKHYVARTYGRLYGDVRDLSWNRTRLGKPYGPPRVDYWLIVFRLSGEHVPREKLEKAVKERKVYLRLSVPKRFIVDCRTFRDVLSEYSEYPMVRGLLDFASRKPVRRKLYELYPPAEEPKVVFFKTTAPLIRCSSLGHYYTVPSAKEWDYDVTRSGHEVIVLAYSKSVWLALSLYSFYYVAVFRDGWSMRELADEYSRNKDFSYMCEILLVNKDVVLDVAERLSDETERKVKKIFAALALLDKIQGR